MSDRTDIRLLVGIPTAGTVSAQFAYSLAGMVARFASQKVPTVPEANIGLTMRIVESSNWISNREKLGQAAIDDDATHLMFLDDDMTFDPRVLETLLGRRQDIVVANYLIKTEPPSDFVGVGLNGKRVQTTEDSTGIQPVEYSGFGASVIRTEVFKRVPQPWFLPELLPGRSEYTTEDAVFFKRARAAGFTVYLDHDASKMVGHIGRKVWSWSEVKSG